MLPDGLLNDLEQRWRDRSPTLLQRLCPGIDDAEIDRVAEPLGYVIPEEVRRWYRWHNGSVGYPILFGRSFGTLSDDVAGTLDFEEDEEKWKKGWLQVMDEKPHLIFDCRGGIEAPAPVWHFDYSFDFDRPTRPVFDSIGDMVSFWIELIDNDQIVWGAEGEGRLRESVPDAIRQRIWGVPTD
jgi:hypothetical protein